MGRWNDSIAVVVTPSSNDPYTVELVWPSQDAGAVYRASLHVQNESGPVTIELDRVQGEAVARNSLGGIAALATGSRVDAAPIGVIQAKQDLHVDDGGHQVSVLFNRPVEGDAETFFQKFEGTVALTLDGLSYSGDREVVGAAIQPDGRVVHLTFRHALSSNVSYTLDIDSLIDPLTQVGTTPIASQPIVITNDRPAGVLFGHVWRPTTRL